MKKDRKTYYFGIKLPENSTIITTNMQTIAEYVGICATTVSRKLNKSSIYIGKEYIIGKSIGLKRRITGFAIK